MDANFRVEGESVDGTVEALSVFGELDQATVPELREAIDAAVARGRPLCVDLSDCAFIDSTGLSLLLETRRRLEGENRGFAVCCAAQSEVRKLLDLTGIDEAIGLFATREEAVASLGATRAPE